MEGWVAGREEESRTDGLKVLFYDLNTAISPRENRISTLKSVLDECNHHDAPKHDEELDVCADKILFQKLAFLFCIDKGNDEIGLLACALELVHRASRPRVTLSFNEIGDTTLPLFVEMIRCDVHYPPVLVDNGRGGNRIGGNVGNVGNGSGGGDDGSHTDGATKDNDVASLQSMDTRKEEEFIYSCYKSQTPSNEESSSPTSHTAQDTERQPSRHNHNINESSTHDTQSVTTASQKSPSNSSRNDLTSMMNIANGTSISSRRWKCSTNPMAVRKIIKVLRYYSRVLSAMIPMARHPGLLDAIIFQLQWGQRHPRITSVRTTTNTHTTQSRSNRRTDDDENVDPNHHPEDASTDSEENPRVQRLLDITSAARIDAMAILVNLACAEENKSKLLYHPGLLEAVIAVAGDDPVDEAREHAAIVLMNLALADMNKLFMASQDHLLDILLKLIGDDKSPHTRRYASTTIFTLASVAENTRRIVDYSDGQILSALAKVLRNDQVDEVRINAAETVFNMMRNTNDIDVVEALGDHRDLLPTLANSVRTDYSADVRAYCARSLEWLAADIHSPSLCHGTLLDALTSASFWTKTTCIGEALKTQSSLKQNRKAMVEHDGLLDALATLASLDGINDDDVKGCALTAIERLTKEESTRSIMASNAGIMTVLTKATFQKGGIGMMERFGGQQVDDLDGDSEDDDMNARGVNGGKYLAKSALKNLAEVL